MSQMESEQLCLSPNMWTQELRELGCHHVLFHNKDSQMFSRLEGSSGDSIGVLDNVLALPSRSARHKYDRLKRRREEEGKRKTLVPLGSVAPAGRVMSGRLVSIAAPYLPLWGTAAFPAEFVVIVSLILFE